MGKLIAGALGALMAVVLLVAAAGAGVLATLTGGATTTGQVCAGTLTHPHARPAELSEEQAANAVVILRVGQRLHVPERGWVIAIATALQESGLRNLDHGDRDSLGLFQQRPSQGWGSPAQILTPTYAARAFYQALLQVPGWQSLPITQAAQAVQHSAYPNAYATQQARATTIVDAFTGGGTLSGCSTGTAGAPAWEHPRPAPAAPRRVSVVVAEAGRVDTVLRRATGSMPTISARMLVHSRPACRVAAASCWQRAVRVWPVYSSRALAGQGRRRQCRSK